MIAFQFKRRVTIILSNFLGQTCWVIYFLLQGDLTSAIACALSAVMLALGIGLQNFPEGVCAAVPMRNAGKSCGQSFLIGQSSGMVEPIAGVLGALAATKTQALLPFALTFSAGAMISVVCSELVPESFRDNKRLATLGVLMGFALMMVLDVALG